MKELKKFKRIFFIKFFFENSFNYYENNVEP